MPRRIDLVALRAAAAALLLFHGASGCGGAVFSAATEASAPLKNADVCAAGARPETVAIIGQQSDGTALPYCTGTLIAPDAVLVAAHCITETPTVAQWVSFTRDLRFLPGADAATRDQSLAASTPVRASAPNPDYDPGSHNRDVGVMFLDAALTDAPLGILLDAAEDAQIGDADGVDVEVVGYGYDDADVFGRMRCGSGTLGGGDGEHVWLFEASGVPQGCNGDSGGGAQVEVSSTHARTDRVLGVASVAGGNCGSFTAFADVRANRAFLQGALSDCTDRAWCDVAGILPPAAFDPPVGEGEGEGEGDAVGPQRDDGDDDAPGCAGTPSPTAVFLFSVLFAAARRRRLTPAPGSTKPRG